MTAEDFYKNTSPYLWNSDSWQKDEGFYGKEDMKRFALEYHQAKLKELTTPDERGKSIDSSNESLSDRPKLKPCYITDQPQTEMKKPTNKAECDALIKELQAMTFNELPKRWEDLGVIEGYYVNSDARICGLVQTDFGSDNRNIFPTSEQAEASIYLAMLMQLRDVYREGWVPDWHDIKIKHCVILEENNWFVTIRQYHNAPFSFQTKERAELFLENFGDYLEKVKPLFS